MKRRKFISTIAAMLGVTVTYPYRDWVATGDEILPEPILPSKDFKQDFPPKTFDCNNLYLSPETYRDIITWS